MSANLLQRARWSLKCVCFPKTKTTRIISHSFDVFVKDNDESRLFTEPPTHFQHTAASISRKETKGIKEHKQIWNEKLAIWAPKDQTECRTVEACLVFLLFWENECLFKISCVYSPEWLSDNSCRHILATQSLSNDLPWLQWRWVGKGEHMESQLYSILQDVS